MTTSTTLAHAAIKDLDSALSKVKAMLVDTEKIQWEIVKPIESLEEWLEQTADMLQKELGFE
jgi:Zn-dependent peptidase ImmA (M78 family)